ncbi:MaoC family dehydratase [Ornithinimicrobium faecis]|uniref:MaoC family dehydratase n=1 Tax=Ornithinimicrobium faecis TaxID=2934158 RepID=UPI00211756A2|nr:MaoC family dehydratase [Ornithinimicrobium sp. HY1745]
MYYEDFTVGLVVEHPLRRTVTEADNTLFSALTMNPQPLHMDEEFSRQSPYGQRIVNSIFTLGLVTGMTVSDMTLGTTLGNLGFSEIKFPNPVFHGDTISSRTEVLKKRESASRPEAGIVTAMHQGHNQRGELVCECVRVFLMKRSPNA